MATRPLVRHFLSSLIGRGVLQDDGVEAVRGLLFSLVAGLISVGFMLPRQFSRVYLELSYLPDPTLFRQAMVTDGMFMLALPFLAALVAAALVAPAMFPDELDFLTLGPLPITRRVIFASKLVALAIFVGTLIASLAVFAAMAFPMFTHRRWAEGHVLARIGAHAVSAAVAGGFGFGCVVALQGIGSVWAPRRWLPRLAVLVPSAVIAAAILSIPFVLQLPTRRLWVATEPPVLAFFPPAWFEGLERVLLGVATPYWQRLALIGAGVTAVTWLLGAVAYARLYKHFERLAMPTPRDDRAHPVTTMGVLQFARATLLRNRLPLLLFLVFGSVGVATVTWQMLNGLLADSFRWDEPPPPALLSAAITMPLILMLTGLTGLRTAFLLPVQTRANWIFSVTDAPEARSIHLAAADKAALQFIIIPALLVAAPVHLWIVGAAAWKTLALSLLAGLLMREAAFASWRRVPFTCTWIPGKRPLVFTLVAGGAAYLVVTSFLSALFQVALFSWPLLAALAGIMLTVVTLVHASRVNSWAVRPLQFEDEPFRVQVLGLR